MTVDQAHTILITGATGYLGSLVAAALAADRSARLVLLIRGKHDPGAVVAHIRAEAARTGRPQDRHEADRITVIRMPGAFRAADIVEAVRRFPISEVIHCAGCLSYWNVANLNAGNVLLTAELLAAAARLHVRRFIYLSSAFCSGYLDGPVSETLHTSPGVDPCPYTASKRDAERLVAESGLPYVMIRPSIVIGDSRNGRYPGKLSGLYQLLWAARRYLLGRPSVIHAVAPDVPLQLVHQDAFQAGFLAAYKQLPDNSIMHLVSREETLPTVRQTWGAFVARYLPECDTRYYDDPSEVATKQCHGNVRQFLTAVQTNAEISSHRWRFESTALDRLRLSGLAFRDASLPTVTMCQDWFMSTPQRSEVGSAVRDVANALCQQRLSFA
jgi:nucleoside-diphosphate-sugar epimerase